jgi:hypothetical protein
MNIDLKCINESSESAAFLFYKKRTCKPADSPDNDLWSKTRKYNTIIRK